MRRKLKLLALSAALGFGLALVGGGGASAAPIDCPAGQTATKTGDWWSCVNQPGHANESGDDKNPHGNPNS